MMKLIDTIRKWSIIFTVCFAMYGWFSFADYAGAKSGVRWRDISGAGWALWVFIILGAIIILLQLIPAMLLFFSVITGTYKKSKEAACTCEQARYPGPEPLPEIPEPDTRRIK